MRRSVRSLAAIVTTVAALCSLTVVDADSTAVAVIQQVYASSQQASVAGNSAQVDPCQASISDICVSSAAGQTNDQAYLQIDIGDLQAGADVNALTVKLEPDGGNTAGNANSGSAQLQACLLTQPVQPFNPQSPPTYDCNQANSMGKVAGDGSWSFDLSAMLSTWRSKSNTGFTILPQPVPAPASGAPAITPSGWSIAFAKSATAASATYGSATSNANSLEILSPPAAALGLPPAPLPPAAAPAGITPPPAPTPAPTAPARAQQAPAPAVTLVPEPVVRTVWLLVLIACLTAAIAMLIGATVTNVLEGQVTARRTWDALMAARSRFARPLAALAAVALLAAGFTPGTVLVRQVAQSSAISSPGAPTPEPSLAAQP